MGKLKLKQTKKNNNRKPRMHWAAGLMLAWHHVHMMACSREASTSYRWLHQNTWTCAGHANVAATWLRPPPPAHQSPLPATPRITWGIGIAQTHTRISTSNGPQQLIYTTKPVADLRVCWDRTWKQRAFKTLSMSHDLHIRGDWSSTIISKLCREIKSTICRGGCAEWNDQQS